MSWMDSLFRQWPCAFLLSLTPFSAHASGCPAADLPAFFREFSADPEMQQTQTIAPIRMQRVSDNPTVNMRLSRLDPWILPQPLLPPTAQWETRGLKASWQPPSTMTLADSKGAYLKSFHFDCRTRWTLVQIDDWALGGSQLVERGAALMDTEHCLARAEAFEALAAPEDKPQIGELFDAALNSYLCAAEKGSAKGAYHAVSLGLSGQAPSLPPDRLESLLIMAQEEVSQAAVLLSGFYCGTTDAEYNGRCKQPDKAIAVLERAARAGNGDALMELVSSYSDENLGMKSPERAMVCVQLARSKGATNAEVFYQYLLKQGVSPQSRASCF